MRFGAHVSAAGGVLSALDRASQMGAEVVQLHTQSPRVWRPNAYPLDLLERYAAEQEAHPTVRATVCHASYLINLGGSDRVLLEKTRACLVSNLSVATRLGAFGLVLHLGSHLGAGFDGVVKKVAAELLRALERASATLGATSCPILLENSAGAGGTLGRSFLELGAVIEAAGADERLGACLDTQHLYASGVSFGSIKEADSVVAGLDSAIGLERLACLHLNDSKVPCGANSDRHENLGEGFIGRQALGTLLAHPRLQHVPAVLEVPGREKKGPGAGDLAVARAIHAAGLRRRRYWLATRRPPPGPRQEPGARRGSRPNRSP